AGGAVDRLAVTRHERNRRGLAALGADDFGHGLTLKAELLLAIRSTFDTTRRDIDEPALLEERFLTSGPQERLVTLTASQSLVGKLHGSYLRPREHVVRTRNERGER